MVMPMLEPSFTGLMTTGSPSSAADLLGMGGFAPGKAKAPGTFTRPVDR